jgi:macrodomain Ter protein organizer (MatP/YcbG family)
MRTILTKNQQVEFLDKNWKMTTLKFKWGKSGSHRCRLLDRNDNQLGVAGGGGYDKKGHAFGQWINTMFQSELKKLNSEEFYGLNHYNSNRKPRFQKYASKHTKTYVDGACGFDCMRRIIEKIGFSLEFVCETNWETIYTLKTLKG